MPIAVGTAIAGAAAGNVGGGIASAVMAKRQAKKQRKFQERMSNTQYQRAMADMRKAGLNPILAYQQGGAGTPSGGQASIPNLSDIGSKSVTTGLAAKRLEAELSAITASTLNTQANTESTNQNVAIKRPAENAAGTVDKAINFNRSLLEEIGHIGGRMYNSGKALALEVESDYKRRKAATNKARQIRVSEMFERYRKQRESRKK